VMMRSGSLELIYGSMYSGKTEELIRRVKRAVIAGQKVQVFKSHRGARFGEPIILSHNGRRIEAINVPESSSAELRRRIDYSADVIAIDEIQFFDEDVVCVCEESADAGKRVIAAGLTLDFRGEPFRGPILALLAKADHLPKLTAICVEFHGAATHTQRLVDGRPAKWEDPIVIPGGQDIYQPVCRRHHRIEKPPAAQRGKAYKVIEDR
jgi:thymidine kinase